MAKRKNVILILSDQQRKDTIAAYGEGLCDIVKTPNIDQLAAEGMKFNNAYTTSAICAPARASVMTGLYPHKHGVIDNFTDIVEGTPLLGECMAMRVISVAMPVSGMCPQTRLLKNAVSMKVNPLWAMHSRAARCSRTW